MKTLIIKSNYILNVYQFLLQNSITHPPWVAEMERFTTHQVLKNLDQPAAPLCWPPTRLSSLPITGVGWA